MIPLHHAPLPDEARRDGGKPALVTFAEAEAIGHELHDHWEKMAGAAPMVRDDLGWGDIVQFVIRTARNVVERRP